jgi:hypothetical protein
MAKRNRRYISEFAGSAHDAFLAMLDREVCAKGMEGKAFAVSDFFLEPVPTHPDGHGQVARLAVLFIHLSPGLEPPAVAGRSWTIYRADPD